MRHGNDERSLGAKGKLLPPGQCESINGCRKTLSALHGCFEGSCDVTPFGLQYKRSQTPQVRSPGFMMGISCVGLIPQEIIKSMGAGCQRMPLGRCGRNRGCRSWCRPVHHHMSAGVSNKVSLFSKVSLEQCVFKLKVWPDTSERMRVWS